MKSAAEKRRNQRHDWSVPIESKNGAPFEGSKTLDLSKGGAGLLVNKFVPVNTKMAVEIDLNPDGTPILAMGQVKWVHQVEGTKSYRVGLSFKDVAKDANSRLKKFFQ